MMCLTLNDVIIILIMCAIFTSTGGTPQTNTLLAYLRLQHSFSSVLRFFSRTIDACLADIRVIRSVTVSDATYVELLHLAVNFTRELNVGYTDCVLSIAASCRRLVDAITSSKDADSSQRLWFQTVAKIPEGIYMEGDQGLSDILVMVQNIGITERLVNKHHCMAVRVGTTVL